MSEPIGPAVARERLRARLRDLREARHLSPEEAAGAVHWPPSTVREMEAGSRAVHPVEVGALLAAYGVTDNDEAATLMALAHRARTPLWWTVNGFSDAFQHFSSYEAEAERIVVYQPLLVPGLLQTQEYATAATAAILGAEPEEAAVGARVGIRVERQQMLAERIARGTAPEILVVLEEAVLSRPIGGRAVLDAQLDHLVAQAQQPHLTLVVMPTGTPGHVGLSGVFELLEFADAPPLVFIESLTDDYIVRDAPATTRYRDNAEALREIGKSGADAVEMIERAKNSLTGT
ncbi:helix-turn-helix transcriptional regulator [Actinoplanes sp. NPDC049316]|uniref:helix-turn-helix domain-containing protein n=1 Tax=Actinoplanes sp. NPDC049316 TaxID=3154727 RepID=UPI00343CE259